ncbi:hypothetical protein Pan258_05510 [Symmachiella dynata]|nr:hypothetical protein Pan258_05510 [Symmachiella dynata]
MPGFATDIFSETCGTYCFARIISRTTSKGASRRTLRFWRCVGECFADGLYALAIHAQVRAAHA